MSEWVRERPVGNEVNSLVVVVVADTVVRDGSLSGMGEIFGVTLHWSQVKKERKKEKSFRIWFGKCTSLERERERKRVRERMTDLQRQTSGVAWRGVAWYVNVVFFCEEDSRREKMYKIFYFLIIINMCVHVFLLLLLFLFFC